MSIPFRLVEPTYLRAARENTLLRDEKSPRGGQSGRQNKRKRAGAVYSACPRRQYGFRYRRGAPTGHFTGSWISVSQSCTDSLFQIPSM